MNFLVLISLLISFSCKTREDIAREKLVSNLAVQMEDGQKLQSDFTSRVLALEERLNKLTGKTEENSHNIRQIEEKVANLHTGFQSFQEKQEQQDQYLQEVLKTLKGLSSNKRSTSKTSTSPYWRAIANYKAGKYQTAKKQMIPLLKSKKIKHSQKARILHNLGLIAYGDKKDQDATVYLGRLFAQYPKSSYNKRGLLFMGKALLRQKKTEEAKQTFSELVRLFPKATQAQEAKKYLKTFNENN